MASPSDDAYTFELSDDLPAIDTLVVGFTEFGLAGLTAVDFVTEQAEMAQVGHLAGGGPPYMRLYADEEAAVGVLVGERLPPLRTGHSLAQALITFCERESVPSITVLTGVPFAHGPDDHIPFYIATDDYRERYLGETDITAMGTGFVDGMTAELLRFGMDHNLAVGVFTTPAHQTHDLTIDTEPLETFANNVESQYRALAERMEQTEEDSIGEDRMYM